MSIQETVRDIENYPSKTKAVTLDLQKIIPIDTEGDEVYILSSAPGTGVTKVGGGTFNTIFVRDFKAGYARSSGKKTPPFNITSSGNALRVSIDGSSYQAITLAEGTGLTGESIADDMQTKINALAGIGQPQASNLAFLNATVEFKNNAFEVVAGTISNTYVGTGKSSVDVISGTSNDASIILGFDKSYTSEELASKQATETVLTSDYTATSGSLTLSVESISSLSAGEAFTITDGTNREYLVASGVSANTISLYVELDNSYATGSIVQKIFERDPQAELASPYNTVDEIMRFALRSIANQIDFSV